jgi:multicomponent Na+:H+ antiporter subunit F
MELIQQFDGLFYGILSVLAVMLLLCLIRAVIGPRIADRLVAVNMMGTMVMVSIALLAVVKDQGYLVDICLIYALISFLAVVVLTRIYTGVYREAKDHEKQKEENNDGNS